MSELEETSKKFVKSIPEKFREITHQILCLKDLIEQNKKKIKDFQERNRQLRGTIEQLREKRREILLVGTHVKNLRVEKQRKTT